eukprot:Skav231384  [mRNA]  locus=scaffold1023:67468:68016:+ [translate_table: standard]
MPQRRPIEVGQEAEKGGAQRAQNDPRGQSRPSILVPVGAERWQEELQEEEEWERQEEDALENYLQELNRRRNGRSTPGKKTGRWRWKVEEAVEEAAEDWSGRWVVGWSAITDHACGRSHPAFVGKHQYGRRLLLVLSIWQTFADKPSSLIVLSLWFQWLN